MVVLLVTSVGELVIDLFNDECPIATQNFLKLCKIEYYHNCLFHLVQKDFIVQTGDPTGNGSGGDIIFKILRKDHPRFFQNEFHPKLKHNKVGVVAMASAGENKNASQFYITTSSQLNYLDGKHTIFGEIGEGLQTLMKINEAYVDKNYRPYVDIRIKHTIVLHDPFDDMVGLVELISNQYPKLKLPIDETVDGFLGLEYDDMTKNEEGKRKNDAQSSAIFLETIGDIPTTDVEPPANTLFVCKLNPVTQEEDIEIIFGRFGHVKSAKIIHDFKTGDNLCFGFIEFETKEECEDALLKMDNALIDDRRIHVDFCQSVTHL